MSNILGNQNQVLELSKIIKNKSINHAYLFCGESGIGKFLYAKEFAKSILCYSPTDTYCGQCEACIKFNNSPDFVVVEPEEGIIKVDAIRTLSENIMLKPTLSTKRCFIIRDADLMNDSAQNALLKILEEPPEYAVIILTAQNKNKVIGTIRSRCTIMDFKPLTDDELKTIFNTKDVSDELLFYSNGSAGRLEALLSKDYINLVLKFEKALNIADLIEMNSAFSDIKKIKTIKEDIDDILDLLIIKLGKSIDEDSLKKAKQIEIIENTRNNLLRNANFDTSLDYMVVQLWEINKR